NIATPAKTIITTSFTNFDIASTLIPLISTLPPMTVNAMLRGEQRNADVAATTLNTKFNA
ncbi:hypothetical protein, partial [Vibrio alginolyticus]|uniref:hypothetical protein n=1 Tax=Vibrio alginolyticus TaxID=663 RepID=UPI003266DECB